MDRKEIAEIFEECGTLLELKGENPFRANAYHNAGRILSRLEGDLRTMAEDGSLRQVKGIGSTTVAKVRELLETGRLEFHDRLRREVPAGLVAMLGISGFGPKRIKQVYTELGISNIEELRAACDDGRLLELKGFGEKLVAKIREGILFREQSGQRVLYPQAYAQAMALAEHMQGHPAVQRWSICGSLRRGRETIKDIDLLIASDDPAPLMERFATGPGVARVTNQGETKTSVVLATGIAADLRVVTNAQFPFALHYFTGSKEHNVAMRARAQQYGLKLNEYELAGPKRRVECAEEADIFAALDLDYIPPELREDTGEIEAAAAHKLPKIVPLDGLTGCFHNHTNGSGDGEASLAEMAEAARALGWQYLGIADHSRSAFAGGLSVDAIHKQWAEIDQLNAGWKGSFRLFKGIESDILADGSLDYDDATLAGFDYVVASIHSGFTMDEAAMTERILRAMRHPACTMLGHPTGRLLLRREGYKVNLEQVLRAAAEYEVMIEINANPHRLDLDWIACKRAKQLGVTLVINPDAHDTVGLGDLGYGLLVARRGWLEGGDILNTAPVAQVAERLAARKARRLGRS